MNYYNPQTSRSPYLRNVLNQQFATSGSTVPLSALDRIIQGELNAESEKLYRNAMLRNQEKADKRRKQIQNDYINSAKTVGLVQTLAQLGTTGAGLYWSP